MILRHADLRQPLIVAAACCRYAYLFDYRHSFYRDHAICRRLFAIYALFAADMPLMPPCFQIRFHITYFLRRYALLIDDVSFTRLFDAMPLRAYWHFLSMPRCQPLDAADAAAADAIISMIAIISDYFRCC